MGRLLELAYEAMREIETARGSTKPPVRTAQIIELRQHYDRLARRCNWPMPQSWDADRPTILGDADNALVCLRSLTTDPPADPAEP